MERTSVLGAAGPRTPCSDEPLRKWRLTGDFARRVVGARSVVDQSLRKNRSGVGLGAVRADEAVMAADRFHNHKIRIASAGAKGRGVFARRALATGEVVEMAPVLALTREESMDVLQTSLGSHAYEIGRGRVVIGLGYASLYNHSFAPNAEFEATADGIQIRALRPIPAGKEVTLDYGWSNRDFAEAGFDPRVP
jgi:hypothetical protein